VVAPGTDLSRYRLVVVPGLYMVSDADAQAITDYVSGGGRLVVTYFSGIVDERDRIRLGGYPGAFRDVLGVLAEEFGPLKPGVTVDLSNAVAHHDGLGGGDLRERPDGRDPGDHPEPTRRRGRLVYRHKD
jgi:beta-galactosidase GanA